jgi:WD40 repeat protein
MPEDKMRKQIYSLVLTIVIWTPSLSWGGELLPIVYSSLGELCSTTPTKAKPACLKSQKEYGSPSWQPNGHYIVAEAGYHDASHELVLLKSDGAVLRIISKSTDFIRPIWSPDGRYIYALNYDQPKTIRRWDSEGKKFTDLPVKGAENEYEYLQMISFSPNRKRAAILLDNFMKMLLVEVYEDHFQAVKTIPKDYSYVSESVWLDDNNLVFIGKKADSRGELWKINVSSEAVQKVGIPGLWLRDSVTLSPDRKAVIVCAMPDNEETKWSLWYYSFGAQHATRITNGLEDVSPSWKH